MYLWDLGFSHHWQVQMDRRERNTPMLPSCEAAACFEMYFFFGQDNILNVSGTFTETVGQIY
jgi:hypothetical protein